MDKLLVSACLLGTPCRYDGKSKADARVQALVGKYEIVPVCPEQLGGLPTPRVPSERRGGGGGRPPPRGNWGRVFGRLSTRR